MMNRKWESEDACREDAQAVLHAFIDKYGRLPTIRNWDELPYTDKALAARRPARPKIRQVFGGWAQFIRSIGAEPACVRKPVVHVDYDRVIERLQDGETLRSVAADHGITGPSLRKRVDRYCARAGIPRVQLRIGRPSYAELEAEQMADKSRIIP